MKDQNQGKVIQLPGTQPPRVTAGSRPTESPAFLQGFTRVPNEIFADVGLTGPDVAVFLAVCSFAPSKPGRDGERQACIATVTRIAARAKVPVRSTGNCLNRLEAEGFLYRERQGKGKPNRIHLVMNRVAFLRDRAERDEIYARRQESELHVKILRVHTEFYQERITAEACNTALRALGVTDPRYFMTRDRK